MKKSVVSALAAAVILGVSTPSFAAIANPFEDVNDHHWAYKAVDELRKVGIITGYENSADNLNDRFAGGRNITRYEMAQLIAKALARVEGEASPFNFLLDSHDGWTFVDNSGVRRRVTSDVVPFKYTLSDINGGVTLDANTLETLRRLAYEFDSELNQFGLSRLNDLRDHSDKLQWHGKVEYTYGNFKPDDQDRKTSNGYVFRLEPVAYVDDNCWVATGSDMAAGDDGYRHGHWSVRARLDANGDMSDDTTKDVTLKRAWIQGEWDKFQVKAGRFEFCPAVEDGVAFDTVISGGELSFGKKWKAVITAGRINAVNEDNEASYLTTAIGDGRISRNILPEYGNAKSTVVGLNVKYSDPGDRGFFGGASYYHAKNNDFANAFYSKDADSTKASIWAASLGYRFNDKMVVKGAYARNGKADNERDAWRVLARYGNYSDASEKGQWAVWAGYSKFGSNVGIGSDQTDDIRTGSKGWHIGAAWAPFKNVGLLARYGSGKYITGGEKYKKIFGRVELFF